MIKKQFYSKQVACFMFDEQSNVMPNQKTKLLFEIKESPKLYLVERSRFSA